MMDDTKTLRLEFASLVDFLDMAGKFLAFDQVFVGHRAVSPDGGPVSVTLVLPVAGFEISCHAEHLEPRHEGTVLKVVSWTPGHRDALWQWVALTWEILRSAGLPGFQGPPPPPATSVRPTDCLRLRDTKQATGNVRDGATPRPSPGIAHEAPGTGPAARRDPVRPLQPQTSGPPTGKSLPVNSKGEISTQPTQSTPVGRSASPPRLRPLKRPRRPLGARQFPYGGIQVHPLPRRHLFTKSLTSRGLAFLLDDIRSQGRTGWLEVTGNRVTRRIRFHEGAVVQLEQRPHMPVDFLFTAVRAVGLDWHAVRKHASSLEREDSPEALLVSLGVFNRDQAERVLSRRVSVQLARAIEEGWSGEAGFIEESEGDPPSLMPDPPVPLTRMVWDGVRAATFKRSQSSAAALRDRLLEASLRWRGRDDYAIEEATHRVEELDIILRCKEDLASIVGYLSAEGKEDRTALSTLWALLQLGFIESERPLDQLDDRRFSTTAQNEPLRKARPIALDRTAPEEPPSLRSQGPASPDRPESQETPEPPDSGVPPVTSERRESPAQPTETAGPRPDDTSRDALARADEHPGATVPEEETRPGVAPSGGERPDLKQRLEQLRATCRRMEELDHFKVLELPWSVHPSEIQPAFLERLKRYREEASDPEPRIVETAQAIMRRLVQAFEVLSDDERRRRYRELLMGEEIGAEVDRLMKQGGLHYLLEEHEEALKCFERAAELAPERPDVMKELERQRQSLGLSGGERS